MIPWTKGMVDIYSILQMEKWLPDELRYGHFSKIQYIQYPVAEQKFHVVLQTLYPVSDVFSTATWSGDIMLESPF